jgi:hypothetical protein
MPKAQIGFELVHEDERGCLYVLTYNGNEVLVVTTNTGFSRGGDLHDDTQYNIILDGEVEWRWLLNGKEVKKVFKKNCIIETAPNVPHMMVANTQTVMIEFHSKGCPRRRCDLYRPIVDDINKKRLAVSTST